MNKGFPMLARDEEAAVPPIETKDELVAYLEAGNKPPADWRIGTEHEKFGFHTADLSPVPYEGTVRYRRAAPGNVQPLRLGAGA